MLKHEKQDSQQGQRELPKNASSRPGGMYERGYLDLFPQGYEELVIDELIDEKI